VFHWTLAAAFAVAFVTEDDALLIHVWAGYVVGVLIVLRVIWGLIGPQHARFSDFVYRPSAAAGYVRDVLLFRAKRYVGHSPGGGAMVLVLLVSLALTVTTGLIVYGAGEQAGPLAPLFASSTTDAEVSVPYLTERALADNEESERSSASQDRSESVFLEIMEEGHEFLANFTLALVLLHVAAVLLASVVHRENLIRAMVTGYKRRPADPEP
jgi:cytochrome b